MLAALAVALAVEPQMSALAAQEQLSMQQLIDAKILRGFEKAKQLKREEEVPFYPMQTAWPRRISLAEREARWMRPEMSAMLENIGKTELPLQAVGFKVMLERNLVQRRGGGGLACELRRRPSVYDLIVDGSSCYFINFSAKVPALILREHGLGSVSCANPDCIGPIPATGVWDTQPLGYHLLRAPCIVIGTDGLPSPLIAMRSKCNSCNKSFLHTDAVTLRRLTPVPELLGSKWIPFDPQYVYSDVFMARSLTSSLETSVSPSMV